MIDRRELILNELFGVLTGLDATTFPAGHVVRNRGEMPEGKRPGIILLDADEQADERDQGRGRTTSPPNVIVMLPEIYVVPSDMKPDNADMGPFVNTWRRKIIKAVLSSASILNACGGNGEIRYVGMVSDLAKGRTMDGELGIQFSFRYALKPDEL